MASLPGVALVMFDGQQRTFDPSVLRTEMERGVPKQRLLNTQVLVKQSMSRPVNTYTRGRRTPA